MSMKEQIQQTLEKGREEELGFIQRLTPEEKAEVGVFERWSAKDIIAHINYWLTVRIQQIDTWLKDEAVEAVPPFDQANLECFKSFADYTWSEVEEYAQSAHSRAEALLQRIDEETLLGPSWRSDDRKMWEPVVTVGYTHKLIHFSDFLIRSDRRGDASRLWRDWVELVSPLDPGGQWQGRVHYNAACGLALAEDREAALEELRRGLELQPALKAWSRLDSDLAILHRTQEYRDLIAAEHWWHALEAGDLMEALADQFLRTLSMLRVAVETFAEEEWATGDTRYQRPAGLALHIAQTIGMYSALHAEDSLDHPQMQIDWEAAEASAFPSQEEFLGFLDQIEERYARFLTQSDLEAKESQFAWTGSTLLSRALYTLRHSQHHLADMAMELQRRGFQPPDWQ